MNRPKFVIVTSQYWDEGHVFVCEYDKCFINNAKKAVEQLEDYKRDNGSDKEYYYGDLKYFNENKITNRYNLNDSGDIYFVMAWSISDLLQKYNNQLEDIKRYYRGRRTKKILNECNEHHSFKVIAKIIEDNFKMVE